MSTMAKGFKELILNETNILKKEVTCPICLDLYTQPITLTTCQHTFCLECFKGLSSNTKVPYICPVCRETTSRRSYYMNEHFIETIKLLQMYKKLIKSLDEGSNKDDHVYRMNRMEKFLDDCIAHKNLGIEDCISISSFSDDSIEEFKYLHDDFKLNIQGKNNRSIISKPNVSKAPIRKTKSLNCTKVKGKYPKKRQKKSTENIDIINIDEYDSPGICELAEEKIVKLLEDDCLKNFENEFQNTKNKEEIQNEQVVYKKAEKTYHKQRKNLESILNRKSGESSSSKKTTTSTGWSRMKTMKKQIIKKQHKYKQLNVSTEINKSKSKSTLENNSKLVNLAKGSELVVVLDRLNCSSDDNVSKTDLTKAADTSLQIKIENISTDKIDFQVQCMEKEINVNKNQEDEDVFSMSTQKLQNPIIQIQNISDVDNFSNFIVDAQVHHSSSPVEILPGKEEIVEKHSSKQVKENICVIEEITKSVESSKVTKRKIDEKESSEELDDVISATERTPDSKKQLSFLRRSSLRSATKRNSNENIPTIENKTPPKRRRTTRQTTKEETVESSIVDQNILKDQNNSALNEEETLSKDTNLMKNGNEEQNFIKNTDFIKNKLKSISENEATVMSALQSSLNAINVMRSNCSSYVTSESLFSDSWPLKNNKSPSINIDNDDKLELLPDRYYSLPLQSNSRTSVDFYATAIPCLKKIEDFYNHVISISQEIANDTENFRNTFRNSNKRDNVIVCYKSKSTKNVETQTDNITCPKCSYIIDFKSRDKIKSLENTVVSGFNELNDIDNISKHFSEDNCSAESKSKTDISKDAKINSTSVRNTSIISKDASQKSSEFDLLKSKNVNRQLTFSEESSNSQRRKFKRIRSPTPDSDSESVKSKKCNRNYSKLLYRDDIDIFFESDPSEKNYDLSLGSRTDDKYLKKLYNKTINSINKDKNTINNSEDTTFISILEREYKGAQFDTSKPEQPIVKHNFDTAPNTVLDNLLGSINLSVFENDNFEPEKNKKSELPNASETENKNNTVKKITQNSVAESLSASMFLTENEIHMLPDVDKTKCIEKIQLKTVNNLSAQNTEDKELDKEVENLTNYDLVVDDSLGSDKDIFGDDNIVENTPQRNTRNKMKRSKFEFPGEIPAPLFDIIEPPATATDNLDWYNIAPPPPPEFQDTEKMEEPKSAVNISSITPDIFALNYLDKGFFANSTLLSGNITNQTIKEPPKNVIKEFAELDVIPNSTTQEKEVIKKQENLTPNNKTMIPSNPDSKIWKTAKRNLNPIVLAQKEKFSPLQINVSQNSSPKPVISSTPKHQRSIMSYIKTVQTPQRENNVNQSNNNVSRSLTPAKQHINKANTFVPIQENLEIEVCESPVPQNNNPSSSFMKENKFSNERNTKINPSVLEKSRFNACIACSRVKKDEVIATITLTQKLGAKYNRDFDKNVTHLIVTVDDRNRIKDHTMKYVLAIAHSVWIVSFAWIRDSLQHNRLLPEEPYEVLDVCGASGPTISRLTRLSNPLFKNFLICCIDPFTSVNRTDIENAVISLGGEIKKTPGELTIEEGKNCLILAEAKETQDFDQYQVWRDTLNVLVVDIEWLSRTIGQYQITSIRPYILCLEKGINDLGYPFALIASVPETPSEMTMTNTNH